MGRMEKALERMKERDASFGRPDAPSRKDTRAFDLLAYGARRVALDAEHLARNRILSPGLDPGVKTSYKMLRTRVIQRMRANRWQKLGVTSAAPGDGKTLTAVNLAFSLAGDVNHTVCLVDLDLRHSSIARYLGIEADIGISDCILDGHPVEEALVNPGIDRLLVLPNVREVEGSSELISSPEMAEIIRKLLVGDPSRIIIFDLPPVLSADDAIAFAPFINAMLLVVSEGGTKRTDLLRTREVVEGFNLIGTVLNRSGERTSSYY